MYLNNKENKVNVIIELATEMGMPCIVRGNLIYVVGEEEIVTFLIQEEKINE